MLGFVIRLIPGIRRAFKIKIKGHDSMVEVLNRAARELFGPLHRFNYVAYRRRSVIGSQRYLPVIERLTTEGTDAHANEVNSSC